jgi:hypothetical protein
MPDAHVPQDPLVHIQEPFALPVMAASSRKTCATHTTHPTPGRN